MDLAACTYEVEDIRLTGFMANGASGGAAPGVLLAHEAPGVTAHVKQRARLLAERGYVAFALDMYGQIDLPIEEAREHSRRLMADAALMREAGADWQLHVFGGVGHSYTNREIGALGMPGFAYDERADRRAWKLMLSLFEEVF